MRVAVEPDRVAGLALKNSIKQKTDEMEQPGFLARMNPFGPDTLSQQSELATLTLQFSQLSLLFMELGYQHIEWATLLFAPGAGLDVAESAEDQAASPAGLQPVFVEDAMNVAAAVSITGIRREAFITRSRKARHPSGSSDRRWVTIAG